MSFFDDMLKQPLPSSHSSFEESGDEFEKELEGIDKEFKEEMDSVQDLDGIADIIGSGPDEGGESDIDQELEELTKEINVNGNLTESDIEDDDEDDDDDDDEDDDEDDEDDDDEDKKEDDRNPASDPESNYNVSPAEPLEGKDDSEADQMLAITATPMLLEEACTCQEFANFLENGESDEAINEGLILESDINQMLAELSDTEYFTEGTFASPNQKYKMTKKARFNQLFELSLQIEARAHHDPLYPKIQKAYKIERTIKKQWRKRYGALAARRAKKYLRNLMTSKSPTLRKAAKEITGGK